MTDRYPSLILAVAALLGLAASVGEWPSFYPAIDDLAVPVVAVSALVLVAALVRLVGALDRRTMGAVGIALGFALLVVGAVGYWQFLLEEIDAYVPGLVAILGGLVAMLGGVTDWVRLPRDRFTTKGRATGVMGLVGLGGLVAMVVWQVVLLIPVFLIRQPASIEDIPLFDLLVISMLSLGLGMGTAAAIYFLFTSRDWSFIDLAIPSFRDVGWIVLGTVGLFTALILLNLISAVLQLPEVDHGIIQDLEGEDPAILLWLLVPASILIIGPAEELLFRNIIQKSLYDYFPAGSAIVVTSLLFGVVHIPAYGGSPQAVIPVVAVFVLSLLLGWIYHRTGNILVPAIIHGLYNAIQFLLLYVQFEYGDELEDLAAALVL